MRTLNLSQIEEPQVRDNFTVIEKEFKNSPVLNGEWRLIDREFTAAGTYSIPHRLGFKPLDVIVTHHTATVTVVIDTATSESVDVTVSAEGRVRFLIGRMK